VISQFEDFLEDKYGYFKGFNEAQFMDYIVNVDSGGAYDDLVKKYFTLCLFIVYTE
jgi:hypothetical protein